VSSDRTRRSFLEKKVTALAMIPFVFTMFIPWIVESQFFSNPSYFWPFMAHLRWVEIRRWSNPQLIFHEDWFIFENFWLKTLGHDYKYVAGPSNPCGLYLGWFFIFACQISTLVLWFVHLFKPGFLKNAPCTFGTITFPCVTLFLGVYQGIVQRDIHYSPQPQVFPYAGFWLAVVSVALLLISFRKAREWESLKRFKTRKIVLGIFLVCVSGFFVINELEFHTKVTKLMIVEKVVCSEELPGDPKLWEDDFNRIIAVASIIRARVAYNMPEYYHCELEVPVISYEVLRTIYNSMGYRAREPTFLQLLD